MARGPSWAFALQPLQTENRRFPHVKDVAEPLSERNVGCSRAGAPSPWASLLPRPGARGLGHQLQDGDGGGGQRCGRPRGEREPAI